MFKPVYCLIFIFLGLILSFVGCSKNNLSQVVQKPASQAVVYIVFSTECPICQKYRPVLAELAQEFGSEVAFKIVFTKWESPDSVLAFEKTKLFIQAPIHDISQRLIKKLGATHTPEVFFMNPKGELLYKGAIDNWFFALGKHRPEATTFYLKNALSAYMKKEPIAVKTTQAVGCLIEK
jgi:thiol-disulfide isomerase/thioredoxin